MKTKTAYLTFSIILLCFTVWGQKQNNVSADTSSIISDTRVNLERKISLESNSKSEDIILNIEENFDRFELVINSSVTAGDLKIEVYDPKGKNQGIFSVGTQLNGEKLERVNGNINKSLKDPQSGHWKVSILPTKATGTITIQTAFMY